MAHRPLFVVYEGLDGSGTTTQIDLLMERFRAEGIEVVRTREPGGTPLGERIRNLVLDDSLEDVDPVAELLLYAASRSQHARSVIGPALDAGKPVICDRYADSTVAYQGGGRGLDRALIEQLNRVAVAGWVPDVTVYVDVTVPEADRRCRVRLGAADRLERAGEAFKERVREEYRRIASACRDRAVWMDGMGDAATVAARIHEELISRWPRFPFGDEVAGEA